MKLFVGLDLGLNKTSICCIDQDGATVLEAVLPSEPSALLSKIAKLPGKVELIGLEACPLSEWIYGALRDAGHDVFVLETRHTERFLSTRPNKTDRNDAHGIATMMRLGHFKPVHVKSAQSQMMRTLLVGRRQFTSAMLQIENTIRGLIRVRGLKLGKVHRHAYSERVRQLCEGEPELFAVIEPLLDARDMMRDQRRRLDNALERAARNDPLTKRFMTIPGVGPLTALAFKATIDDPSRFKKSKLVPAHLGLTPRVYQSGDIDRSGHISKAGDSLLRYLLVEAATSMLLVSRKWCALKAWAIRIAKRSGRAKAIIALARRIAIAMHAMWVSGEEFCFGGDKEPASKPA
ncbi:MAG: IS110 family transposase [Roseitalea porphyridii]|jgi:transposase|uniref:IS110 family transposase n=1 Tax=Pseudomonadota TaxID=1224 RepID=UPI0032EEC553